jgi:hypothetical protein
MTARYRPICTLGNETVDEQWVARRHRPFSGRPPLPAARLRGVGMFDRAKRAAARQQAAQAAQAELDDLWRQAQQAQAQQELDTQWARLAGNDPGTVLATLAEAFEDNEAPAGIDGTAGGRRCGQHLGRDRRRTPP